MMILSLAKIFLQNVAVSDELQIWDSSWIDSTLSNVSIAYMIITLTIFQKNDWYWAIF